MTSSEGDERSREEGYEGESKMNVKKWEEDVTEGKNGLGNETRQGPSASHGEHLRNEDRKRVITNLRLLALSSHRTRQTDKQTDKRRDRQTTRETEVAIIYIRFQVSLSVNYMYLAFPK